MEIFFFLKVTGRGECPHLNFIAVALNGPSNVTREIFRC